MKKLAAALVAGALGAAVLAVPAGADPPAVPGDNCGVAVFVLGMQQVAAEEGTSLGGLYHGMGLNPAQGIPGVIKSIQGYHDTLGCLP